jgi:ABC-2 type transport system ATP-binding protein
MMAEHEPSVSALIETAGLRRHFGPVRAVDGVDLAVPPLAVYGFLGANGAGKTTTIRMLLGLIRPDAGDVRLFGRPLGKNRLRLLARVGALVEAPSLYPHLTGRENLRVTARLCGATAAQIDRALAIVRLTSDAGRVAGGYSLGMQQRLGLALALLREPELLILDEPTNGLDPAGIREIRELVRSFPAEHGVTVFISSHLLSEVEQTASHVGIIHHGRLLFQGELMTLQQERRPRVRLEVGDVSAAAAIVEAGGWTPERDGDGALLVTGPSITRDDVATINQRMVAAGVAVYRITLGRPSLEEMFLDLTRADAPDAATAEMKA